MMWKTCCLYFALLVIAVVCSVRHDNMVEEVDAHEFTSMLDALRQSIVNVAHTDRIIEGLRFVFVELPKFKPQTIKEKKMAVLWLRFLTEINKSTAEVPAELLENPDTCKALKILEKSAYTEAQLYAYERYWDAVYNERGAIRHGYNQGLAEGREAGRAEGREAGRAEGRAEGRVEEKLSNARSLKENGVPSEVIAKSLGLAIEDIEKL